MTPERHRRVGELYHAALALAEEERTTFLEHLCGGDADLLRDVQSLLTAHRQAGNFIARPRWPTRRFLVVGRATLRALRSARPARRGRHGRGVSGTGRATRARCRDQDPPASLRDRSRAAHPLRARGAVAGLAEPSPHRRHLRVRSQGWCARAVLEPVDGDTLAERIARGPIAISEALHVAHQIAEALEAAHESGIIHRDLKPANIKITLRAS